MDLFYPPGDVLASEPLDALTRLPGRLALLHRLGEETEKARRFHTPYALLFLDIDQLKKINTSFGQLRGDQVLVEIAHRLKVLSRDTDFVFRFGGDEFAIVLPGTPKTRAVILARRLIDNIYAAALPGNPPLNGSLSIGIASYPEDGTDPGKIFAAASLRHKLAKHAGRRQAVSEHPSPAVPDPVPPPGLMIERERALQHMGAFLQNLSLQGRAACRIEASPGTGGSRFLTETQTVAGLWGFAVFTLYGKEKLSNRAYGVLSETIQSHSHLPAPLQGERAFARAIQEWLVDKGKAGLLITLDNIQFIDPASLAFLERVFFLLDIPALGLIYVDAGQEDGWRFPGSLPLQEVVQLPPLTQAGVRAWLEEIMHAEIPARTLEWLYKKSAGKPAHLQIILNELALSGKLTCSQEAWRLAEDVESAVLNDLPQRQAWLPPNNLPTSELAGAPAGAPAFFGRQAEITALKKSVLAHSLTTLSGPGGIGKSRLALQVASEILEQFPDGAFVVSLAAVRNVNFLITAIADALGVRFSNGQDPLHVLLTSLSQRKMLLVLDHWANFAQGLDFLRELIRQAPGVRVLLTSRERLNIRREHHLPLQGLAYPDDHTTDAPERFPAVQLFLHAAHRSQPYFRLDDRASAAAGLVSRQILGSPLAVEMAGAWAAIFPPELLANRISQSSPALANDSLDGLGPFPHFIAVLDLFWNTFSSSEQSVLEKLAIFEGSFSAEAARFIADASLFFLDALVAKKWLTLQAHNRYIFHDVLSQYISEKLRRDPRANSVARDRHSEFFLRFLEPVDLLRRGDAAGIAAVRADLPNIRAAWNWALSRSRYDLLRDAAAGLAEFYHHQGHLSEAEHIFGAAIEQVQVLSAEAESFQEVQRAALLNLLVAQASLLIGRGKFHPAVEAAQTAVALSQSLNLPARQAQARLCWAQALSQQALHAEAAQQARLALDLAQSSRQSEIELDCLHFLGVLYSLRQPAEAQESLTRAVQISHQMGDARRESDILSRLGMLQVAQGEYQSARANLQSALNLYGGQPDGQAHACCNLGFLELARGAYAQARAHFEQALQLAQEHSHPFLRALVSFQVGVTSHHLGDFPSARGFYEQSAAASRKLLDWSGEASCLSRLGLLGHHEGNDESALEYQRRAQALIAPHSAVNLRSLILLRTGRSLLALGRWIEAQEAFQQGLILLHSQEAPPWLQVDIWAGLADLFLHQGQLSQAFEYAPQIYNVLDAPQLTGSSDDVFQVYLVCAQVFSANQDERAAEVLRRGLHLLDSQSEMIPDPPLSAMFLESIPSHREIRQAAFV